MNFPYFLAKRITVVGKRTFSKLIARVAIGAIMLGIAVMILAIAVLKGFKHEVTAKQRGFFGDIVINKYDLNESFENSPFFLKNEKKEELLALGGVTGLQEFATKAGIINVNDEVEGVVLKGVGAAYDQQFINDVLIAGNPIDFSDSTAASGQLLISRHTANRLRLSVGDDFIMYFVQERIRPRKFEIVGIYNTSIEELDKTYVIGAISLIRRLNDWSDDEVGGYELTVGDFDRVVQLTEEVGDALPIKLEAASIREKFPEIFQWLDLLDANPRIILVLMVIVAVINMISALLIMILERTSMIGILKALGCKDKDIRKVFLYNAMYLVGLGLLMGNFLGLGLYYFQDSTRYFKLDEASYYVSYIPVSIKAIDVLLLNLGVMAVALLALLIPSYLIGKVSPIKAIQFK